MIITITGTPGSGKTYIAKKLAVILKCKYFDLNKYIKENKLYDSYDKKDKTFDVNSDKISSMKFIDYNSNNSALFKLISEKQKWTIEKFFQAIKKIKIKLTDAKKIIIIDSHLSHYVASDVCIVVKSDIKTISKRLSKREYSKKKIKDNVESEIFDICLLEAMDLKRKIVVIEN